MVHVVLLRGINLVRRNRVSMPELRAALAQAGLAGATTYLQSGNVVVGSPRSAERVAREVRRVIEDRFGFAVTVLVRSRAELAQVVSRDPLRGVATNPRRYIVTFLSAEPPPDLVAQLAAVATEERYEIHGREVYSWHPDGIGRTPLWERLSNRSLGVGATSRNWATVTALLAMADARAGR